MRSKGYIIKILCSTQNVVMVGNTISKSIYRGKYFMNIKTLKMISTDQSEDIKRLDNSLGIYADQILECDRVIKDAKIHKDLCMEKLKEAMGNHVAAKVSDYFLDWGFISYKAQPEKITPAKEARTVRKSNIKIKKI